MFDKKKWFTILVALLAVALIAACTPAQPEAPVVEEPTPTEAPPAAEMPTELRIAVITCCGIESMWDASFFEALERIKAEKPHDLNITWDWTDGVWGDDAEQVMREYAETGEYNIIWATSSYSDQAKNLMNDYPDTMFVYHGSGNEGLGNNAYWLYMRVHEPAYLLGTLAGRLTESNKVGVVGTFAFDDVNDEINAYFQGAKDVNPEVEATVSFIESWYDPVKGNEATNAQAAAGVDYILQLGDGWEACIANDIICFGNFGDQNFLAPDHVPSSTLALWDPGIKWLVDEWWTFAAEGKPYSGNVEKRWFSMADGGSDFADINDLGGRIPADTISSVMEAKAALLSGELSVPLNIEVPESD